MNTLVSVVVPIYNAENYLRKCLDSIRGQDYGNIEVILIDDGSADSSADICLEYCGKDPRFRYFYQTNSGVGAARNLGIAHSNGDFICFVDSDDWVQEDFVSYLLDGIQAGGADIAVCNKMVNGKIENQAFPSKIIARQDFYREYIRGNIINSCCVKLFCRGIVGRVRFVESKYFLEDMIYTVDCFAEAERVVLLEEAKYNVLIRSDSLSHRTYAYEKKSAHLASKLHVASRLQKHCVEEDRPLLAQFLLEIISETLRSRVDYSCYDVENDLREAVSAYHGILLEAAGGDWPTRLAVEGISVGESLKDVRRRYLRALLFSKGRTGKEKLALLKEQANQYLRV